MKIDSAGHNATRVPDDRGEPEVHRTQVSVSSPSWEPAERVVLDLELPHTAIAKALDKADDAAIWYEHARARDQKNFLATLSALAGRYSTQQQHSRDPSRNTEWRHSLIAVPFLVSARSLAIPSPAAPDRAGTAALVDPLRRWAGDKQPVRLLVGNVKYIDLSRWSPVMQRQYLQLLAGQRQDLSASSEATTSQLPDGVPQLAFAVGSVRCWNAPPQIPCAGEPVEIEWELRGRIAACLTYLQQSSIDPARVLLPARLCDAVLSGVRMWFDELARSGCVQSWDLQPAGKDILQLEMRLQGYESAQAVIPLRLHQLGCDTEDVIGELTARFGHRCVTSRRVH